MEVKGKIIWKVFFISFQMTKMFGGGFILLQMTFMSFAKFGKSSDGFSYYFKFPLFISCLQFGKSSLYHFKWQRCLFVIFYIICTLYKNNLKWLYIISNDTGVSYSSFYVISNYILVQFILPELPIEKTWSEYIGIIKNDYENLWENLCIIKMILKTFG